MDLMSIEHIRTATLVGMAGVGVGYLPRSPRNINELMCITLFFRRRPNWDIDERGTFARAYKIEKMAFSWFARARVGLKQTLT
jgi:hypothetical protein